MKPFLTAHWKNLVFFNYEIDPAVLYPYLPAGTELDFYNNKCYVSLVGFMFLNTKIKGVAFPFHRNFEEFNLRFYVRFKEAGDWKRGVVFIKEIVPRIMITTVARFLYGEKYYRYPMRNKFTENSASIAIEYAFLFKKEWNYIKVNTEKNSEALIEASEPAFITEHYWGYTRHKPNQTSEYKVEHPKWNIFPVISHEIYCNSKALYGDAFYAYLQNPSSVFMAEGSDVKVYNRKLWSY